MLATLIVAALAWTPWLEQQLMKAIIFLVVLPRESNKVQPLSILQAFLCWQLANVKTALK